nr:MAG TPA: hypothetical protein [Caudoviricetes sp.]
MPIIFYFQRQRYELFLRLFANKIDIFIINHFRT